MFSSNKVVFNRVAIDLSEVPPGSLSSESWLLDSPKCCLGRRNHPLVDPNHPRLQSLPHLGVQDIIVMGVGKCLCLQITLRMSFRWAFIYRKLNEAISSIKRISFCSHPPALSHVSAVEVAGKTCPAVVGNIHRLLNLKTLQEVFIRENTFSSENFCIETTGPKISSWHSCISGVTPVRIVGLQNGGRQGKKVNGKF